MIKVFSDVFIGVAGSIAALLAVILAFLFLMPIVRWLFYKNGRRSRTVHIESTSISEASRVANEKFIQALYIAFANFRQSIAILEGRLAMRDSGLSYFTDCAHLMPSAENINVQVEVGPVRFGNILGILSRYIGKREFTLKITVIENSKSDYSVFASLSLNRRLWHTWQGIVEPDKVNSYCRRLVREIIWATSCQTFLEAHLVGYWKQYELNLLEGMECLATYLRTPSHVEELAEAARLFENARHEPWSYQADLLSAISLSLAQREPRDALQRMQNLMGEYGYVHKRKSVLTYNCAVAHFHLYDMDGDSRHYDDAICLFESIKRPWLPLWLPLNKRVQAFKWTLYLLAQVGISNCLAHKLNVTVSSNRKEITSRIQTINAETISLVRRLRKMLDISADEIEWRIFNAEAVTELFGLLDAEKGITAAKNGLNIDPQNLPLRANLGSLMLLKARQSEEQGDMEGRTTFLKQAERIFIELQDTGWDPGFIAYRLGRIRRLQGKFSEAIEFLESAKNKDVANKRIEDEIEKSQQQNNRFD